MRLIIGVLSLAVGGVMALVGSLLSSGPATMSLSAVMLVAIVVAGMGGNK